MSYMENEMSNIEAVKYNVPGLERGIEILEYLTKYPKGRTLQEIYLELHIPQTTAYRILCTFIRCDYVVYCEETKRYKLSMKILMLGYRTLRDYSIIECVLPRMRELRDSLHDTVCFGVWGDGNVILVEQVHGDNSFCFTMSLGTTFELHCSAPGKAIMAFLPRVECEKYLDQMVFTRYNDRTITDIESYKKELERVFESGFAVDMEEELTGVMCVGAPILNHVGYPCGAVWISAPKDRIVKKGVDMFVKSLKDVALQISKDMGHNSTMHEM